MTQLALPGMKINNDVHDFQQRLIFSQINSKLIRLEWFYKSCFQDVQKIEKVDDLKLQKQGIDTIIYLTNGKRIYFDEKIREKAYSDILIEEYSVWQNYPYCNGRKVQESEPLPFETGEKYGLVPGWLNGTKKTDYITYVKKPTRTAYFLPFLLLRRAFKTNYHDWILNYGRKIAKNQNYTTSNVAIPTDVLYQAIYKAAEY